jgi:hypothetical protein
LACAVCGKNNFDFPEAGGDDALVTCAECGHEVGTLAQVKDAVANAVTHKTGFADLHTDSRGSDAR